MNQFKKGDKVIYHGGGTNQTMQNMGAIGTVVQDSYDSFDPNPKKCSITIVKWTTGPYARSELTWYTSNLDLYKEDDV